VLAWVSELISADLRNSAFSHLQRLSLQYFGGKRTGDLINRISSETDRLCSFLSDTLIDFITDVLMILGTSIVLFALDPLLALAALASFPPIAWFMMRVRGALTHGFLRGSRAWAQMTNILSDTIPGIRVVKAFSQEQREVARFERANASIVAINNRVSQSVPHLHVHLAPNIPEGVLSTSIISGPVEERPLPSGATEIISVDHPDLPAEELNAVIERVRELVRQ